MELQFFVKKRVRVKVSDIFRDTKTKKPTTRKGKLEKQCACQMIKNDIGGYTMYFIKFVKI